MIRLRTLLTLPTSTLSGPTPEQLFTYNIQPLVHSDRNLCPQGFGQYQHIPWYCIIWPAEKKKRVF